jgi:hypothetical protein
MNRRDYLALTGTALTTAVAGCSGSGDGSPEEAEEPNEPAAGEEGSNTEAPEEETTDTDAEEQPEPEPTEEVDQPEAQSFSGSGAEVEQDVPIGGGLTVVEATHTNGESNFQVSLVGGEFDDLFVNAIGEYDGETAALIDEGEYTLDVEADGDWEVEIRQPRAASGDSLPQSLEGDTPEVHGPFEFDGSHVATGSHSGEANFQVHVYPAEGSFGELVFNEVGQYDGETTFRHSGVGWVAVQAGGDWSLELE